MEDEVSLMEGESQEDSRTGHGSFTVQQKLWPTGCRESC